MQLVEITFLYIMNGVIFERCTCFKAGLTQRKINNNLLIFSPLLVLDIDECEAGTNDCSVDAVCNNTKGAFSCTCKQGFVGSGYTCEGEHDQNIFLGNKISMKFQRRNFITSVKLQIALEAD